MLRALQTRDMSAVELLQWHIRRIERYDSLLNAIVVRDFEEAGRAAARADELRAQGNGGRLLGLPVTVKEAFHVRGLPVTGGEPERRGVLAAEDAPPVARLRAAGAILMGKTNTPTRSRGVQCANPLFGRTNNPWDLERTPGGSSGGSAAAVAAGLSPLDLGSDSGGSIRIPAAFCGVFGHKPSEAIVARSGYFPESVGPLFGATLSERGPICRSAEDLEIAMDVLVAPELDQQTAWTITIPAARHRELSEFRVAVLPIPDWLPVHQSIRSALEAAIDTLGRVGGTVAEAQPDSLGDLREYHKLRLKIAGAVHIGDVDRPALTAKLLSTKDEFDAARACGVQATAADYVEWLKESERYRQSFREFFKRWDVLLAPIVIVPAHLHSIEHHWATAAELDPYIERELVVNGQGVRYSLQGVYPTLANLSGHPATAFPIERARHHLPVGIQAIGPYLEDRTAIRFASLLANETGGFVHPPGYDDFI